MRIFKNMDLDLLNAEVNLWLFELPAQGTNDWVPHMVSIQYDNYTTLNPPGPVDAELWHTVMVTFYVTGTLLTPYSG